MPLAVNGVKLAVCAAVLGVCAAVLGCALAACGEADSAPSRPGAQQQCVQAVFDVLDGMITKPYDSRPFAEFVTRYGTQSVTYSAYLDVFSSFRSLSTGGGVRNAEDRLRGTVTRDCAGAS